MEHEDAGPPRPDLEVLLAAIEASGEAILITSAELDEPGPRIEYANPAFSRMTGYQASEVLGRTPRILQGPRTDRAVLDRMHGALAAGEPFQGEALNYRKDGSTYMVEWLITPVRDAEGHIVRWVSAQRDITERHAAEDRQNLLVRELHHRVKNTLATVQAVLNASLRSSLGLAEFRQAFTGRIASLAKTHALITEDRTQAVAFQDLLTAELKAYDEPGRRRVTMRGPHVLLPSELAVPVGMAPHELAMNAVLHGALADLDGCLELDWSVEEGPSGPMLHWTWNEHDGPPVALPTREGFGSQLLNRVLTQQIGAKVDIAFDPDGLRVDVAIPFLRDDALAASTTRSEVSAALPARAAGRDSAVPDPPVHGDARPHDVRMHGAPLRPQPVLASDLPRGPVPGPRSAGSPCRRPSGTRRRLSVGFRCLSRDDGDLTASAPEDRPSGTVTRSEPAA